MRMRSFVLLTAILGLAACSSADQEGPVLDSTQMTERESISSQPVSDVYGEELGTSDFANPNPNAGTQSDLVKTVGDRIFFGYDRYDLDSRAQGVLESQAKWLKQYATLQVTVEGHADERGTREYNLALGERRANSVRNYLVALGVAANRITTISYGKERPAVAGSNARSWSQNRRSVLVVQ